MKTMPTTMKSVLISCSIPKAAPLFSRYLSSNTSGMSLTGSLSLSFTDASILVYLSIKTRSPIMIRSSTTKNALFCLLISYYQLLYP